VSPVGEKKKGKTELDSAAGEEKEEGRQGNTQRGERIREQHS
jgi:hypothetical protein